MAKTEKNSGGKKFQGRQPGEKRVRKSDKAAAEIKSEKRRKTGGAEERPRGKSGFGKSANGGEKRSSFGRNSKSEGGYTKSSGDNKFDKRRKTTGGEERSSRGGYAKSSGDDRFDKRRKTTGGEERNGKAGFGRTSKPGEKRTPFSKKSGSDVYTKAGAVRKTLGKAKRNREEAEEKLSGMRREGDKRKVYKDRGPVKDKNYKGSNKAKSRTGKELEKGSTLLDGETRLNRYISNSGICSRREADVLIEQGLVTINGTPATELGTKVKPGDVVKVDGKKISPEKPVYILLNKPKGYITTMDDPQGRKTVMELIDLPGSERIYPVGRLDRNTTGVLLLTNDGELAQKLMHPSFEIKKVYKAKLDRKPSKEHMLAWVNGVELEDGWMSFDQIGFVDTEDETVLGLEISSGRNRIVRRMFEFFDYEVEGLDRVLLGEFDKMKLGRGKWRFLSEKEINYIEKLKRMKPKKK